MPTNATLWVALIRAQLSGGDAEQARLDAERSDVERPRRLDRCSKPRLAVEAALGETDAMRATLTRLRGQARGDASLIARSFLLEGELEASLGNIDEALAAYTAADVANPDTPCAPIRRRARAQVGAAHTGAAHLSDPLPAANPDGPACAQEARLSKEPSPAPPERPMP